MENVVFLKLKQDHMNDPLSEIFYWSNPKSEVDFVLRSGANVKALIQVTYASSKDEVNARETNGIISASSELHCNNLLVITWDYEAVETIKGKKIKFIPLWKWLLNLN